MTPLFKLKKKNTFIQIDELQNTIYEGGEKKTRLQRNGKQYNSLNYFFQLQFQNFLFCLELELRCLSFKDYWNQDALDFLIPLLNCDSLLTANIKMEQLINLYQFFLLYCFFFAFFWVEPKFSFSSSLCVFVIFAFYNSSWSPLSTSGSSAGAAGLLGSSSS